MLKYNINLGEYLRLFASEQYVEIIDLKEAQEMLGSKFRNRTILRLLQQEKISQIYRCLQIHHSNSIPMKKKLIMFSFWR